MTPGWIVQTAFVLCWLGSVSAHAEAIQITIDKLVFAPADVTAKVGDTIEWVNNDILAHTATATNKDWDVAIAPKRSGTLVLKKAGAFDYFCRYHPNMKGRITVAP
jgi:plastocyanin